MPQPNIRIGFAEIGGKEQPQVLEVRIKGRQNSLLDKKVVVAYVVFYDDFLLHRTVNVFF